jgi:hypothetical protein
MHNCEEGVIYDFTTAAALGWTASAASPVSFTGLRLEFRHERCSAIQYDTPTATNFLGLFAMCASRTSYALDGVPIECSRCPCPGCSTSNAWPQSRVPGTTKPQKNATGRLSSDSWRDIMPIRSLPRAPETPRARHPGKQLTAHGMWTGRTRLHS